MALSGDVFDLEPNIPITERGAYDTQVHKFESWKERRVQRSRKGRREFELRFRARTLQTAEQLYAFYDSQSGDFTEFKWKNPMENPVMDEVLGTGDNAAGRTIFNLKRYPVVTGDLALYKNNVLQTAPTDYTVQDTTGAVTMEVPVSGDQSITANYNFYRKVRFAERPLRDLRDYKLVDLEVVFQEIVSQ